MHHLHVSFVEWQAGHLVVALGHDADEGIEPQSTFPNGEIDGGDEPSDLFADARAFETLSLEVRDELATVIPRRVLQWLVAQRFEQRPSSSRFALVVAGDVGVLQIRFKNRVVAVLNCYGRAGFAV